MTNTELVEQSNIWDSRYNLPTSPQNNNPWFYMACTFNLIGYTPANLGSISNYYSKCLNLDGTINRWPSSPSQISQDELLGASFLSPVIAAGILRVIQLGSGYYSNTSSRTWNEYMLRFPWLIQYVKSRSGVRLSTVAQVLWAYLLVWDLLITHRGTQDASGRYTIWLMSTGMEKYIVCSLVIKLWRWRMNTMGVTPKQMFTLEPKENPVLAQIAPEEY